MYGVWFFIFMMRLMVENSIPSFLLKRWRDYSARVHCKIENNFRQRMPTFKIFINKKKTAIQSHQGYDEVPLQTAAFTRISSFRDKMKRQK